MMRRIVLWVLPLFLTLGLGPGAARADVVYSVFNFAGLCFDCSGTANAELTLSNYTLGSEINTSNFVSFHYDGTDLQPTFTITSSTPNLYVDGRIYGPFPESEDVTVSSYDDVSNVGLTFESFSAATGQWCVGQSDDCTDSGPPLVQDYGFFSSYSLVGNAVPEPMSIALLGGGLVAGFAMRRRRG